jgi:predicted permease
MTPGARPPRVARFLLRLTVTADLRDAVATDLDELFERDLVAGGAARARLQYWRTVLSFAARFLVERLRDRARVGVSWMDVKFGFRLLIKYPGLTLVGGLAMAFAIAVGAASFEFVTQVVFPTMPLQEGHRIVGIRLWHTASHGVEEQGLFDFAGWRGQIGSIEHLGAFRDVERNLIAGDVPGGPIWTAEITASAFVVAGVPALHGRTLVEADEQPGAPAVVVLGHDVWQARFGGDPDVIGRTVQAGGASTTVVGVMPEGFAFPRFHSLWVPLRLSDLQYGPRQGPWINIFGRLAPGATLAEAQAEMTAIGRRTAAAFPATHEHIRPEVMPYGQTVSPILTELGPGPLLSINLFFVMLLALVCANIALLMFARAAAREGELAVRTALGASRRRIVGQLFAEALALGSLAAIAGLAGARLALRAWLDVSRAENDGLLPFWYHDGLSAGTVIYTVGLTILGAAIAGIVPALKMTGHGLETRLRQSSAGGGGVRFGGVWTAVIVAQVAVTVAFPATAWVVRRSIVQVQSLDAGFPSERYLSARLEMSPVFARTADGVVRASFPLERYRAACDALDRRLAAEPGVLGVTFTDRLPRTHHPARPVEIEGDGRSPGAATPPRPAASVAVSVDYFDVLGAPVRAGRAFQLADLDPLARTAIVNDAFVTRVLDGRAAIGRRVRDVSRAPDQPPGPWLEIVGVVSDLGVMAGDPTNGAGIYRPAAPGAAYPTHVAIHVQGDPGSLSPRLRSIAAAVDPTLHLHDVEPLDEVGRTLWLEFAFLFRLLVLVSAVALLLSLSAIYSTLAFAVARRTREIGVRVALGAGRRHVATAIFSRPLAHVGIGVVVGAVLTAALARLADGDLSARGAALVAAYALVMMGVCLLACITPARRALDVDPIAALKEG